MMAGLYFHVPFCKQACHYCDFHFSTDHDQRQALCEAMARELIFQKGYLVEPLDTLYFGGGTPSLLAPHEIDILLLPVHDHFSITPGAEVTLEANPDDLTFQKIADLRSAGINRLSIGIQTFDNDLLKLLNRVHDANTARRCLGEVRKAGFQNISIDLIYAIPGLSEKRWEETLLEAIQFSPEHISSYSLTLEEKTVFGNWSRKGKLRIVEEEVAATQFEILMEVLTAAGYEHYEISNFCKPGYYSRHNSGYWKQSPYLGIGPSAHSYDGHSRQFNVRSNAIYLRSIENGSIPFEREVLSRENKVNEYLLTTLRTRWGCNLNLLKDQLNEDLLHRSGEYISQLQREGLLTVEENMLRLTRRGKLFADKIAEDLMVPV